MPDRVISMRCPSCGGEHSVCLSEEDFGRFLLWQRGIARIQDALPGLSPVAREQLLSRLCPDCQRALFAMAPEEDD